MYILHIEFAQNFQRNLLAKYLERTDVMKFEKFRLLESLF